MSAPLASPRGGDAGPGARRRRALVFALLALAAAGLAASMVDGYRTSVIRSYGPLRPVIVTSRPLPPERDLGPAELEAALSVRRVPARFAPPGAITSPAEALGLRPVAPIPAGAYLLRSQLRRGAPPRRDSAPRGLEGGRRPVEIAVAGAGALLGTGSAPAAAVDVVVTTEPRGAGSGRTYVAAAGVPLLAIGPGADGPGPGGAAAATLALTRGQALHLIAAENFARQVRLLPRPPR
jgi:pilus assembly protein CpaB